MINPALAYLVLRKNRKKKEEEERIAAMTAANKKQWLLDHPNHELYDQEQNEYNLLVWYEELITMSLGTVYSMKRTKGINKKEVKEWEEFWVEELEEFEQYFGKFKKDDEIDGELLDKEVEKHEGDWLYLTKTVLNTIDALYSFIPDGYNFIDAYYITLCGYEDYVDGIFYVLLDGNKEKLSGDWGKTIKELNSWFS